MPKITIPLILPSTARGWQASVGTSAKDQQLINGLYQVSSNSLAGSKAVYVQKRPGSSTGSSIGTTPAVLKHYSNSFSGLYTADTPAKLFEGTTSLGVITNIVNQVTNNVIPNALISGVGVVAFVDVGDVGWFLYEDAIDNTFPTFSGDRTSGSPIITNIASTTGIYKGQAVSGTGIPADTRVLSVDSATEITLDKNATSGAPTTTTITKEAVAKITDAQFPNGSTANANSMEFMDGYFFVGTDQGNIQQSAINDPANWAATDVIGADYEGDGIRFIFKWQNHIVAAGKKGTIQYFYNAGNASGSVLSNSENLTVQGIQLLSRPVVVGGVGYCVAMLTTDVGPSTAGLYRLSGANTYQVVSDDFWSSVISDGQLYYVGTAVLGNKPTLLLHGVSGSANPVIYDTTSGQFSVLDVGATLLSSFTDTFSKSGASTVFNWSPGNSWQDSSSAYTLTAQTEPKAINKGQSFIIKAVDLLADTEASGVATLYVSRDDYATWENVGTFDMTAQIKRIHALGWFPSTAAFKVEHAANTNFRPQALIADVELCHR